MFQNPFSFEGRIQKKEYIISFIVYIFAIFIIGDPDYLPDGLSTIGFLSFIPLYWFIFAQGAKRCHDLNRSGWYQLIPFYVFFLLFETGLKTKNKYDKILDNHHKNITAKE